MRIRIYTYVKLTCLVLYTEPKVLLFGNQRCGEKENVKRKILEHSTV